MTDTLYQGHAPDTKPGEVFALIPKAMEAIGAIRKSETNKHFNYKFRGIDQIYNAFHGPLSELGLFIVPHSIESIEHVADGSQLETRIVQNFRIYASDGSYVPAQVAGIGIDSSDKGAGKAHTAAYKTLCFEVFMPPLEDASDIDGDKDGPTRKPQPPKAPPKPKPEPPKAPKVSPLTQAKREALDAIEDIRLGQTDALDNVGFLKKVSTAEYGPDGATTVAQVEALVTMARAGVWELSSGDRIPEEV